MYALLMINLLGTVGTYEAGLTIFGLWTADEGVSTEATFPLNLSSLPASNSSTSLAS
jgi:hypothetical protein